MKTEKLKMKGYEFSHLLKITPRAGRKEKQSFTIPVIDVRDNRLRGEEIIKQDNVRKGSKFIKSSFSLIGRPYN